MGIKKFRPMTPGTRTRSLLDNELLTRKGPEKSADGVTQWVRWTQPPRTHHDASAWGRS